MAYKLKPYTAAVTSTTVPKQSHCKASIDNSVDFTEWLCFNGGLRGEIQKETRLIGKSACFTCIYFGQ
jgi:hypothetical protein